MERNPMKTVLVSFVSDQTIPNILAIHHFSVHQIFSITGSVPCFSGSKTTQFFKRYVY